jgi:predicted ATPase
VTAYPPTIISRLQVKNYKSLADIDVTFGSPTVLVGTNGSGKSNVIDVLRFVRDIVMRGLDAAVLDRHGMSAVRRWSAKGAPYDVHIHLYLENAAWSGDYSFTLGSEKRGEYRVKAERLALKAINEIRETAFPKVSNPFVLEIKEGKWVKTFEEERFLPKSMISDIDDTNLVLPRIIQLLPYRHTREAYRFLSSMGFYNIYPAHLREPQKPSNPYPLEEEGQNIASVLRRLKQNKNADISTMTTALERVVDGIHDYSVTRVGGYLVTRLHHSTSDEGRRGPAFELAQESDGTLRMLGILTALYQDPPRSLITIEEPELNVHPGAVGVLCDVLQEASMRGQVLITTHNPDLIDRFAEANILVVEKEEGITSVGPIVGSQREAITRKLFSPGELMRVQGLHREEVEL